MKKRYIVDKHGTETPVKGHKHKLRNHPGLADLPEELIATDDDDPDKVSALDAPHIKETLVEDHVAKLLEQEKKEDPRIPKIGQKRPLDQFQIDLVRLRVCRALIDHAIYTQELGIFGGFPPQHIWFPDDNSNKYEIRDGWGPTNEDRPKHLKHYKLEIDPPAIVESKELKRIIKELANA